MDQQPFLDFIEFSLLPFLGQKEIQLIQLKITQAKPKSEDPLFLQCFYYRKAINLIRKHKRHTAHLPQSSEFSLYAALTLMEPQDILLVLSDGRYPVSNEVLSLVLDRPIESLEFRRNQMIQEFQNEGLKNELKKLKTIPLSHLASELETQLSQPAVNSSLKLKISRIGSLPAPARFILEMIAVLVLLFFILWLVPQIRSTYENSVQKRINEYLVDSSLTDSPPPAGAQKPQIIASTETEDHLQAPTTDSPQTPSKDTPRRQPRVSEGETWRFSFTGQGQTNLESEVTSIIQKKAKDPVKPSVVPGGTQFEFTLPTSELISLKTDLEELTSALQQKSARTNSNVPSGTVNLSWYKKKIVSTRKIPSGRVLVIVWISSL